MHLSDTVFERRVAPFSRATAVHRPRKDVTIGGQDTAREFKMSPSVVRDGHLLHVVDVSPACSGSATQRSNIPSELRMNIPGHNYGHSRPFGHYNAMNNVDHRLHYNSIPSHSTTSSQYGEHLAHYRQEVRRCVSLNPLTNLRASKLMNDPISRNAAPRRNILSHE